MLHNIGLLIHVFGITMILGGFMALLVIDKQFWKLVDADISKAGALLPLMKTLPIIIQLGALVQIISGIMMLSSRNWQYWGETWLYVKLVLFVALVTNGFAVGKPTGGKIAAQVFSPTPDRTALTSLKGKMRTFNMVQLIMLLALLFMVTIYRHM
jgi:uncharacterized membrane protein